MQIKNDKIKMALLMLIIIGCFNKREIKTNIIKEKGYLKKHLKKEEWLELKEIIKSGNSEMFESFLDKHEEIIKNYPIIVKVLKSEIMPKSEELIAVNAKYEFNEAIMRLMIKNGYDKKTKKRILSMKWKPTDGSMSITPLMAAAYYAPKIIVERLEMFISEGEVNVNEKNEYGMTALMYAITSKNRDYALKAVLKLIKAGAKVNKKSRTKITALHMAVIMRNKDMVALLLEAGANVHKMDSYGRTALSIASNNRDQAIIKLLVKAGALLHEKYSYKFTVLHKAVEDENKRMVALLLELGKSVHTKALNGSTALHMAFEKENKEIIELLLNAGANVNEKNERGHTVLHIAVEKGNKELVELLLSKLATDLDKKARNGCTALHIAVDKGYVEIAKLLIKRGAKVNIANFSFDTPLSIAYRRGNAEIVKLFFNKGVNVNMIDKSGITRIGVLFELAIKDETLMPLFVSIINSELRIYRILLERKISEVIEKIYRTLKDYKEHDKLDLEKKEALNALKTIGDIGLHFSIVNQIFTDVFVFEGEDSQCKFILKNREFKFEKIDVEKFKKNGTNTRLNSTEIINLLLMEII